MSSSPRRRPGPVPLPIDFTIKIKNSELRLAPGMTILLAAIAHPYLSAYWVRPNAANLRQIAVLSYTYVSECVGWVERSETHRLAYVS